MDKELLFDTRLVRRWIAKDMLSETELKAHLEKLKDCSENTENMESSLEDHAGMAD